MNIALMHLKFDMSFDAINSFSAPEYTPEARDILFNESQNDFMNMITNLGIEENQTYTDYLANLVTSVTLTLPVTGNKPFSYMFQLPADYRKMINEEAQVKIPDCKTTKSGDILPGVEYMITEGQVVYNTLTYGEGTTFVGTLNITTFTGTGEVRQIILSRIPVKPTTRDRYSKVILNPFKSPYEQEIIRLEYKKPSPAGQINYELVAAQNIIVNQYFIDYYKNPVQMQYGTQYATPTTDVDCELNDEAANQIVEMAVVKAKKIIGSPEFQTFLGAEVMNTIKN